MSDRDGWFDGRGLDLLRENFLDDHEGWKKYIEDSQITAEEILEQENRIISMLRDLEPTIDDMALIHYPSVMDSEQYWSLSLSQGH